VSVVTDQLKQREERPPAPMIRQHDLIRKYPHKLRTEAAVQTPQRNTLIRR
jgi:hypothetical protein